MMTGRQNDEDTSSEAPLGPQSSVPSPLIAIVGRPNVGKSALFNRLVGRRQALVEDLPGTTRDRLYGESEWRGRTYRVVDTGGLEAEREGPYSPLVRRQIEQAMQEADVILLLVDARDGLTAADAEIADLLRPRATKPVMLVANKVDNERRLLDTTQFYEVGLGEPFALSAYHGVGVADLLDEVFATLEGIPPEGKTRRRRRRPSEEGTRPLRLAIIGRPNVGKSALLNALVGDERVIVSDIPGTTRDVIDTAITFDGRPLTLLDTAGIRRPGRIDQGVERHSVQRARDALARADVALCVMDATEPAAAQDTHIVGMADEARTGIVLVLNKMDLLPPGEETRHELAGLLRARFKFVPWAPVVFVSAKERRGLTALLRRAVQVGEQRDRRVPTAEVNQVVRRALAEHAPPSTQGRRLKVLYVTQAEVRPPTFVFEGTVIRLVFKSRVEDARVDEEPGPGEHKDKKSARPTPARAGRPARATRAKGKG